MSSIPYLKYEQKLDTESPIEQWEFYSIQNSFLAFSDSQYYYFSTTLIITTLQRRMELPINRDFIHYFDLNNYCLCRRNCWVLFPSVSCLLPVFHESQCLKHNKEVLFYFSSTRHFFGYNIYVLFCCLLAMFDVFLWNPMPNHFLLLTIYEWS